MSFDWSVRGEKQGKHVGAIWNFDLESRILVVSFAILSVSQAEDRVKKAVAEAFGMKEYVPVLEIKLPPNISATQYVTLGLANIDRLLAGQKVNIVCLTTVF